MGGHVLSWYTSSIKLWVVINQEVFNFLTISSALEVLYIKPVNATALKLKTGHSLLPTKVHYQSIFNETGALMTQYTSLNVASFEINVDDSVPGYLHTFSLFVAHMETPVTSTSYSFGKSLAGHSI